MAEVEAGALHELASTIMMMSTPHHGHGVHTYYIMPAMHAYGLPSNTSTECTERLMPLFKASP